MRALVVVVAAAALSAACAPMYGAPGAASMRGWSHVSPPGPSFNPGSVTGRWDNVMMLPRGARIHVLQMDGTQAEGDLVSANVNALKMSVAAGDIDIAAENVARIDRVAASGKKRQALSGAAHGAGFVGLLGLLAGQAPPVRLFAAGALAGAEAGYHSAGPGGPQTVYLASQLKR